MVTPVPALAVAKVPKAVPLVFVQVIALLPLVVQSPLISAAVKAGELPRTSPVSVLPVPVPPFATGRTPDTPPFPDAAKLAAAIPDTTD